MSSFFFFTVQKGKRETNKNFASEKECNISNQGIIKGMLGQFLKDVISYLFNFSVP